MKQIGRRLRPIDWDARSAGRLAFTADLEFDGLLEGAILRSPYPHARIRAIDTTSCRAMPGVQAVVTAADFPAGARYFHEGARDRAPLADGVVRFVGQEVAAVAAETRAQALAALRAIDVTYEPLPAPVVLEEATGGEAGSLHDRPTGKRNLSYAVTRNWGAPEDGRRAAAVSASGRFRFPRQAHACMETNITVAKWDDAEQRLHLWTSTQAPFYIVKEVSQLLGLETRQVVCHEVGVGGGFGAKSKICEHEAIAAVLARAARRPVRIRLSREEEFEATKTRHAFATDMTLHADAAGRLRLIEARLEVENGAYNHSGVSVLGAAIKALGMLYKPDGVIAEGRLIDTATNPGGQFRGYGSTQTSFAVECLMDELAEALKVDPVELRLRNANLAGETTTVGARLGSARLIECLKAARDAIGWNEAKANRRDGIGVGIASGVHVSGSHVAPGANRSDAAIDIFPDSRVRVRFGGSDAGTGQKTILAQIAAEELGVDAASVDVLTMDSDRTPFDMGAWSSRGTHYGGHAVRQTAQAAAARLKTLAAATLGDGPLRLEDGAVRSRTGAVPIGELARRSNEAVDGVLSVETSFVETNVEMADRETGRGNVSASYNFAAHAARVAVDRRTGRVKILDYVAAHDVGTAINPTLVETQAIGGTVMGLGAALGEEVLFEQGKTINPAFLHYALPRAADAPRVRPILIEGGDPLGPYGAKAIGECGVNPPASALANAVYDAVGVRIRDLPITPDKILQALAAKEGRRRRHPIWRRPSRWWIALVRWAYPRGLLDALHARAARFPSFAEPAPLDAVVAPATVPDAVSALRPDAMAMGGGTDLQPRRRQRLAEPRRLVALRNIAALRDIRYASDGAIEIGAAATLARLAQELRQRLPVMAQAIDTIASPQIREMATLAGNLAQAKRCWFYRNGFGCYKRMGGLAPCYAIEGDHRFYHAVIDGHRCQATTPSDLAGVLQALDAEIIVVSATGERRIPIAAFYNGPGETVLGFGDLIRAVHIPAAAARRRGGFAKLRLWEGDFAIVSAAVTAVPGPAGSWQDWRIVLGGVAPVPWRAHATESALAGAPMTRTVFEHALNRELDAAAHPLKRNGWKIDAAAGIVAEAIEKLIGNPL